jgi:acyl-coenzyme A thioesterase PaaI-like protein
MGGNVERISIQQQLYPDATCFGCGQANPKGLHLASYPEDGYVGAFFQPWPEHDNGLGYLNGGIIATVLDCHSGAAAFHEADVRGWPAAEGLPYPFVTSGLDVRYRRPAPLLEQCELRAYVVTSDEDFMTVEAELLWDGKQRAWASSEWRRWRPRG